MSLFTALIVKNIYFIFLRKRPTPNLKSFQYQIWTSVKKSGKSKSTINSKPSKCKTRKWVEIMMMRMECISPIAKLNLKLQY